MIRAEKLCRRYGSFEAVRDLSFHLEEGKIYGLLGPNGAGKSTTMNMLTGYLAPTSGEIIINGHDMRIEPEEARRCIGYLPEIPPLYMEMTVKEYLLSVAEMKGIARRDRLAAVRRVMKRVEIDDRENKLIRNLSKGYRQRTGIAQALLADPPVIILDEPTVGLDPRQILTIRALIRSLKDHHTVIVSSHILTEISEICDDVLIIHHGELTAQGAAADLEEILSGERVLYLQVSGTDDVIDHVLAGFAQIRSKECKNMDTDADPFTQADNSLRTDSSCREIRLTLSKDADIRKELFFAFAKANCPILEMRWETHSLEDVFMKLTRDQENDQKEEAWHEPGKEENEVKPV